MAAKDIEAGRAYVTVSIRDRLQQGLKTAERQLSTFGRATVLSAAVVSGATAGSIAWPLKLAANMESTQTSFEVMLGSAERAKQMLTDIEKLGADTPFTFDQLKDSGQMLLNFNVQAETLLKNMTNIGNVAAGDADRFSRLSLAFGQVTAKGRLMGGEVNQMIEAGFNPLTEISRTTGRSMADLTAAMEKGEISAAMLHQAFASASSEGGKFDGMMAKQSKTLIGLVSTLADNGAMMARAFGSTLLPVLKQFANVGITLSKIITTWVADNQELVGVVAMVVAGTAVVATIFGAIGASAMALSFIMGLVASGFATVGAVLGFVFSPIGAVLGLLIGLGVAAYQFRDRIMSALPGVTSFVSGAVGSLGRLWSVASETFGGIVSTLASGDLALAGQIAWAGLLAVVWTATAEVMAAVGSLLDFIDTYVPGVGDTFREVFGGIGNAILAGRWDIAGSIAMLQLKIALMSAWNGIANTWSNFVTGFGSVWDTIVYGMRTTFRTMVFGIAQSIVWIAGKISDLLGMENQLAGVPAELERMQNEAQAADDKERNKRDAARTNANAAVQNERAAAMARDRDRLAGLNAEAGAAANSEAEKLRAQGFEFDQLDPSVMAAAAQKRLSDAVASANAESEAKKKQGQRMAMPALGASDAVDGKAKMTAGTFSAVAAVMLGASRSDEAAQTTARNTTKMVTIMQKPKAEPGFAP